MLSMRGAALEHQPPCAALVGHSLVCYGSKGWRREDTEHYHPAMPEQQAPAMQHCDDVGWDKVPAEVDAIVAAIQAAIDKLPLHEDEAKDIVEYTYYETQEVREAFLSDTWSDATAAAADRAFQLLLTIPWTHSEEMTQTEKASVTHADLNRHVGAVDSDAVWSRTRDKHVTPLRDAFELPVNWEAELSGSFESLSVSALRNHLRPIIPTQLSAIWHLVLKGHSPTLDAPAGFLGTKLAVTESGARLVQSGSQEIKLGERPGKMWILAGEDLRALKAFAKAHAWSAFVEHAVTLSQKGKDKNISGPLLDAVISATRDLAKLLRKKPQDRSLEDSLKQCIGILPDEEQDTCLEDLGIPGLRLEVLHSRKQYAECAAIALEMRDWDKARSSGRLQGFLI
eukprot:s4277_g1.t1